MTELPELTSQSGGPPCVTVMDWPAAAARMEEERHAPDAGGDVGELVHESAYIAPPDPDVSGLVSPAADVGPQQLVDPAVAVARRPIDPACVCRLASPPAAGTVQVAPGAVAWFMCLVGWLAWLGSVQVPLRFMVGWVERAAADCLHRLQVCQFAESAAVWWRKACQYCHVPVLDTGQPKKDDRGTVVSALSCRSA